MAVDVAVARRLFTRAEYHRMAEVIVLTDDNEPEPDVQILRRRCVAESIDVHRAPGADGYRDVTLVAGPGSTVAPQAFPDVTLALTEIFA